MFNYVEELGRPEYRLNVAEELLDVLAEPLLNQQPVLKLLQVLRQLHLLHVAVLRVVHNEQEQAVIVCVVNKLQKGREVILIVNVELAMDLHVH